MNMADRIERIGRVSFDAGRWGPVRRYTPEERAEKIKEIEQAAADRAELRALLAKYPNPNHLSFAEYLTLSSVYIIPVVSFIAICIFRDSINL